VYLNGCHKGVRRIKGAFGYVSKVGTVEVQHGTVPREIDNHTSTHGWNNERGGCRVKCGIKGCQAYNIVLVEPSEIIEPRNIDCCGTPYCLGIGG
jgi:hypothetical protein